MPSAVCQGAAQALSSKSSEGVGTAVEPAGAQSSYTCWAGDHCHLGVSLGFTDRPAQACNGGTADGVSLQPDVGCGLQMCALSTPKDAPFVFWALTSSLSFLFPLLCQFTIPHHGAGCSSEACCQVLPYCPCLCSERELCTWQIPSCSGQGHILGLSEASVSQYLHHIIIFKTEKTIVGLFSAGFRMTCTVHSFGIALHPGPLKSV